MFKLYIESRRLKVHSHMIQLQLKHYSGSFQIINLDKNLILIKETEINMTIWKEETYPESTAGKWVNPIERISLFGLWVKTGWGNSIHFYLG